jgi:creatinine amidohydrolase/Fe(II)-dependent formamide hydrolase-like protein
MLYETFHTSTRNIANLNFGAIEDALAEDPTVLLPLGGLEPVGDSAPLGCSNLVCRALSVSVAERTGILFAPLVTYGCTTSYRGFAGVASLKADTLANTIYGIAHSWKCQGLKRLVIMDGIWDNTEAVDNAVRKIRKLSREVEIMVLRWQTTRGVRAYMEQQGGDRLGLRAEHGLLSMAAYLDPSIEPGSPSSAIGLKTEALRAWRRRSRDPAQFRKLCPDARTSAAEAPCDSEYGRLLLGRIVDVFCEEIWGE